MSYAADSSPRFCADVSHGLPCREARMVMARIALPAGSGKGGEQTSVLCSAASSLDQAHLILHSLLAMWLVPGY